jgi:hypothetical protein
MDRLGMGEEEGKLYKASYLPLEKGDAQRRWGIRLTRNCGGAWDTWRGGGVRWGSVGEECVTRRDE